MKKHKPLISEDKSRVHKQIIKIVFSKFFSRPKHTFMYLCNKHNNKKRLLSEKDNVVKKKSYIPSTSLSSAR